VNFASEEAAYLSGAGGVTHGANSLVVDAQAELDTLMQAIERLQKREQ
jgi:hypothetical protein